MTDVTWHAQQRGRIVFKLDIEKHCLLVNFERRHWHRARDDEDWHLYWASTHSIRHLFDGRRLGDAIINHFPNHFELTRKDLMVKNIKRYRKEREKESEALPQEWVPTTFSLPSDYALFVEEFRRNPTASWIAKPTGKAQGKGIFLVSKLEQVRKWAQKAASHQPLPFREPYIISRYISNPLLVGGKKFDMRLYVLVTSYRPLRAYLYKEGFCRFSVEQYTSDVAELDNVFVHLTNVAIQKQAEDYNEQHGGKWSIDDLMLFIESTQGQAAHDKLRADMEAVIVHSLRAVQGVMINDKRCFELYGFDILLDQNLRPWLLEVNASPSLSATTPEDRILKVRLINDVLNTVVPPNLGGSPHQGVERRVGTTWCDADIIGGFVCILDDTKQRDEKREKERDRRRPRSGWR